MVELDAADGADDSDGNARLRGRGLVLSTKVQVSGHMFFARRAVLAMTRRRVRMEAEPGRRQSMALLAGVTLTAVLCLGALFWSLVRPAGSAGQSRILADQNSGALYVRVGDKLYPALNLSSARLIAGEPVIRIGCGAAKSIPIRAARWSVSPVLRQDMSPTSPGRSSWLVCDEIDQGVRGERTGAGDGDGD